MFFVHPNVVKITTMTVMVSLMTKKTKMATAFLILLTTTMIMMEFQMIKKVLTKTEMVSQISLTMMMTTMVFPMTSTLTTTVMASQTF